MLSDKNQGTRSEQEGQHIEFASELLNSETLNFSELRTVLTGQGWSRAEPVGKGQLARTWHEAL